MAATYLGKKVSITNGNASLTGGTATWTYNLGTASATTQLAITDTNGKTVFTATGETTSGNHAFTWDGKDMNGNQLADGTYKLTRDRRRQRRQRRHHLGRQRRHRQPDRHDRRHAQAGRRQHGIGPGRYRRGRATELLEF